MSKYIATWHNDLGARLAAGPFGVMDDADDFLDQHVRREERQGEVVALSDPAEFRGNGGQTSALLSPAPETHQEVAQS